MPKYGKEYAVTIGDACYIDIMNRGISKGSALGVLENRLRISTAQMMAFGDTYNDIEMLQTAKYSFVMENADPGMRQYANFIAPSNNAYGVVQMIEKLQAQDGWME